MVSETINLIAERYSLALFELAEQQSCLDVVAKDLTMLKKLITENFSLNRLFKNPISRRIEQQKIIVFLSEIVEFCSLTKNFLELTSKNRRLFAVDSIISFYLTRIATKNGDVNIMITSVTLLTEKQVVDIRSAISKIIDGNIILNVVIDPCLLGGIIIKFGSLIVDGSLKTKLQRLQLAMKGIR